MLKTRTLKLKTNGERKKIKAGCIWLEAADTDEIRHFDRTPELHHSICSGSVKDFQLENNNEIISASTSNRFMLLSRNFCSTITRLYNSIAYVFIINYIYQVNVS